VPLKTARLAVKVLQLLKLEARASKLSFNDVIKRLAAQEPTELTFISKKARYRCAAGVACCLRLADVCMLCALSLLDPLLCLTANDLNE
jgi:hypothetical protein